MEVRKQFRIAIIATLMAGPAFSANARQIFMDDFEDGNVTDGKPLTWDLAGEGLPAGKASVEDGSFVLSVDPDIPGRRDPFGAFVVGSEDTRNVSLRTRFRILDIGGLDGTFSGLFAADARLYSGVQYKGERRELWISDKPSGTGPRATYEFDPITEDILLRMDVISDEITTRVEFFAWSEHETMPDLPQLTLERPADESFDTGTVGFFIEPDAVDPRVAFRWFEAVAIPEPTTGTLMLVAALIGLSTGWRRTGHC